MELILIRHTKVNINKGICYGFTDVDVADSFLEEADKVKQTLQTTCPDMVWTSPLKRCIKLSQHLFKSENIQQDNRLKELNFGNWEMQAWDTISNSKHGIKWMDDFVHIKCPEGESFHDQYERVVNFLNQEVLNAKHKTIAIIAHGGTIRSILCYFKNTNLNNAFDFKIDYGSITRITIT